MLPVLLLTADGRPHSQLELRESIADQLGLSEEELAERIASDYRTAFASRIAWAVQYLKSATLIQAVRRGVYQITDRGVALLKTQPSSITAKTLRQYPEFAEFEGKRTGPKPEPSSSAPLNESIATPEESLESGYQVLRDALAHDLLEAIRNGTPAAFEQVVVDLLVAMGYGGSVEDAGKVVGRSGDGGIDGIIKHDKLGLDVIYVQAKRWKDTVGSPEIMKFSGSLTKRHASRGVFIATSTFTREASEFVEALSQKIVLIDGTQLASLMIEHNVGVSPTRTITLKRLDQDYFDNL